MRVRSRSAATRVKSVYRHYHPGVVRSGLTGAQVAAEIVRRTGVRDVDIMAGEGMLGDRYDPIHQRLVLSADNSHGRTPAALGVAAHECGHAIQHERAYFLALLRPWLIGGNRSRA